MIYRLDIDLNEASQPRKQSAEWDAFLTEMTGQLFFLIGTLLLKRAAKVCCFDHSVLTLKAPNKNCSRQHFNFLLLSFKENKA